MKVCGICKQSKDESEFGKAKQRKDGLHCNCKICMREYSRKYSKTHIRVTGESSDKAKKLYRERNPLKAQAHGKVAYAIRCGRLAKRPCEVCGNTNVFAHHDDYNFPLKVRWLCDAHHKEWHKHNTPKQ